MVRRPSFPSIDEMRQLFRYFCAKHGIQRLEIFGSAARGNPHAGSDLDLLVTFDSGKLPSTADLLEMAGEAEELAGLPVDFVVRKAVEDSPNRFAREDILGSAVCVYGG